MGLYRNRSKLVIPELENFPGLVELVTPLVNIADLPTIGKYKPSETIEINLGQNQAEVLWHDPFSGAIALRTAKGNALCPTRNLRGLGNELKILKKGEIVTYSNLAEPAAESSTKFEFIAQGVMVPS